MTIIGYARVSTADQKLDMQMDALCDAGCNQIFTDAGMSGARQDRPGLDDALSVLARGDTLVVWKLDRLGRSVQHLSELLVYFLDHGIEFRSLSEGIDTTTMTGKLVFHIFSAIGEFERDLVRERTACGMAAAKKRGKHIGRPVKANAKLAASGRRLIQSGLSQESAARELGLSVNTLRKALLIYGVDGSGGTDLNPCD